VGTLHAAFSSLKKYPADFFSRMLGTELIPTTSAPKKSEALINIAITVTLAEACVLFDRFKRQHEE
jgi:hypothetical protein